MKKKVMYLLVLLYYTSVEVWFETHQSSDQSCHLPQFFCLAHKTLPVQAEEALKAKLHPRQTRARPNRCRCSSPESRRAGGRSHGVETVRAKRWDTPGLVKCIK